MSKNRFIIFLALFLIVKESYTQIIPFRNLYDYKHPTKDSCLRVKKYKLRVNIFKNELYIKGKLIYKSVKDTFHLFEMAYNKYILISILPSSFSLLSTTEKYWPRYKVYLINISNPKKLYCFELNGAYSVSNISSIDYKNKKINLLSNEQQNVTYLIEECTSDKLY
jgi:hypothetical protein